MTMKARPSPRGVHRFVRPLAGVVLLIAFALALNALLSSGLAPIFTQPEDTGSQLLLPTSAPAFSQGGQPQQPIRQSPSPSAGGKTDTKAEWVLYQNNEYDYIIKYPPTFFYKVWDITKDPIRMHYISFIPEKYRGAPQAPEIGLVIYRNPQKVPLREWLDQHTGDQSPGTATNLLFEKVVDLEQTTLAGAPAFRFVEESPLWGTRAPSFLLSKGEKVFRLFYTNAYSGDKLGQTFDLMLGTFQLTQK